MYDTILIATDGSDRGTSAAEHGVDLASEVGADVHAIYVIETKAHYPYTVAGHDPGEMDDHQEYGEEVVEAVVDDAVDRGLDGVGAVRKGSVAEEILTYADERDADAIVIGAQGRSGLDRYLLGGTAEKILRAAEVPVIVVHDGS